MNPKAQFSPNSVCHASGINGLNNITMHSWKKRWYKGTAEYGLKKPVELIILVITLLVNGCPAQAIVAAFGLDPRTVASWQKRAGEQARQVHEHIIGQSQLNLGQMQVDEIWPFAPKCTAANEGHRARFPGLIWRLSRL